MSDEELQTMLQASALTGIPAAILAGLREGNLVAVPREPTRVMLSAGERAAEAALFGFEDSMRAAWAGMLIAAQDRTP